jgi:hypothetical protein
VQRAEAVTRLHVCLKEVMDTEVGGSQLDVVYNTGARVRSADPLPPGLASSGRCGREASLFGDIGLSQKLEVQLPFASLVQLTCTAMNPLNDGRGRRALPRGALGALRHRRSPW